MIKDQESQGIYDKEYEDAFKLVDAVVEVQSCLAPENQVVTPNDVRNRAPAARARRQREAPAGGDSTEEEEAEDLRFLSTVPVMSLVAEGERPMRLILQLGGMLGSTVTQRRTEKGSSVRVMSALLKHYIQVFLKLPAPACTDEILAATLKQFLAATEPDELLCSGRTDEATLRSEAIDSIRHE